jgi:hypothetical protein
MMHAWDHDQSKAERAFGSDLKFAKALKRVAPPHGLSGSVRLRRGICVETAAPFAFPGPPNATVHVGLL